MKALLVKCGICSNWYSPRAHYNHCPCCNAAPMVVHGKRFYVNPLTERTIIKAFWTFQSIGGYMLTSLER